MKRIFGLAIALGCFSFAFNTVYQPRTDLSSRAPAQAPFHSATLEEMANPRCLNQDHIRRNDVQTFLKKYSDISRLELPAISEVEGIRFENEHPELVYRFMQLVTSQAPEEDDTHKDSRKAAIKKAFGKANGCNKVLCAVQRLFGKEEGPLILLLLTEYDLNLSHYAWENAAPWKTAEIHDIMKAIEATPSHLLPLDLNKKMIHFKRGFGLNGGQDTIANATIEVFDVWNQEKAPIRQYSIYHEFSHNWSWMHANDSEVSPEWLKISGWDIPENPHATFDWKMHPGTQQVSIYAKTNPFEDFAESVSAYRYAPQRLKAVSLEKYKFVKDVVYSGMEFTGSCPRSTDFALKYALDFSAFDQGASPEFIADTALKCLSANIGVVKDPSVKAGFLSCLSIYAANEVLKLNGQTHEGRNIPLALYDVMGDARVRFLNIERSGTQNLKDLLIELLLPHAANIQESVKMKDCENNSFDSALTAQQAKGLNVQDYDMYFGMQGLTEKVCRKHLEKKQSKVTAKSIADALKGYF